MGALWVLPQGTTSQFNEARLEVKRLEAEKKMLEEECRRKDDQLEVYFNPYYVTQLT